MALPHVFANVTELDTPDLDENFNAVADLGTIHCVAVGTDTINLTPAADSPTISAYTDVSPVFGFIAAATNTGAVTLSVSGVGGRNVYKNNGATALVAGDFIVGRLYFVSFNAALNSGAGGWVVNNPGATAATAGAVQGTRQGLSITNLSQSNPDKQVGIGATSLSVSDGASNFTTLLGVSAAADITVSGANGLDTGSAASSTWYAIYIIYNPSTLATAALLSTNFTLPTLPTGYTQYARIGAIRTDGSTNFFDILQKDNVAQYVISASGNTLVPPNIANGALGTFSQTAPTLASASVTSVVPSTASEIHVVAANQYNAGAASFVLVAPSTSWGGANRGPAGSASLVYPIYLSSGAGANAAAWILLESTAIAWAASAAGGAISCLGWKDNL